MTLSSVGVRGCLLILISLFPFCAATVGGSFQLLLPPYFCCICIEALGNCYEVLLPRPLCLVVCVCAGVELSKSEALVPESSWREPNTQLGPSVSPLACESVLHKLGTETNSQEVVNDGCHKHFHKPHMHNVIDFSLAELNSQASIPPSAKNMSVISSSRHFYYVWEKSWVK